MALTKAAYVLDAVRTPIGKYRGGLSRVRPDDLAARTISALGERRPGVFERLDHVVFGATNQAGEDNRNVARMALLLAGISYDVPGVTVNRLCGSGLEAIEHGSRLIALGEADVVVAGGVESMTRAPYSMPKASESFSRTPPPLYDTTLGWRYPNPRLAERFELLSLGETAENVAKKFGVSRTEQDEFALASHQKAANAWEAGAFATEIVPVTQPGERGESTFSRDESIRVDTTLERLAALAPAFKAGGSVTAGNSSPLNDGAAAVCLVSEAVLKASGARPLARVLAGATVGVDPNYMGEGPIAATKKALSRAGLRVPNVDLVELNEAFAAQAIACERGLGLDPKRVNVNGGAIALGHPVGASGARIVVTLLYAMQARGARVGLATLCIGVGQGMALLFERA
jgi:3-oxoadipyl-CoA thiolase